MGSYSGKYRLITIIYLNSSIQLLCCFENQGRRSAVCLSNSHCNAIDCGEFRQMWQLQFVWFRLSLHDLLGGGYQRWYSHFHSLNSRVLLCLIIPPFFINCVSKSSDHGIAGRNSLRFRWRKSTCPRARSSCGYHVQESRLQNWHRHQFDSADHLHSSDCLLQLVKDECGSTASHHPRSTRPPLVSNVKLQWLKITRPSTAWLLIDYK